VQKEHQPEPPNLFKVYEVDTTIYKKHREHRAMAMTGRWNTVGRVLLETRWGVCIGHEKSVEQFGTNIKHITRSVSRSATG
jgi:hypothetical protein